jgi:hypothetical protein
MRDVVPILLRLSRREIAYVKFVFESYEGVATVRTLDPREARLVVLAAADFVADARAVVAALRAEGIVEELPLPAGPLPDWLGREP